MRNFSFNCLILSTKISGENNRTVCALSEDEGIFYTTLYGGPKSKMKSLVSPFNRGKIWIYKDEVKKSSKITDFEVAKYHPTFSESLFKTQIALLACEIVIKTNCEGNPRQAFYLLNGFLDGLDLLSEPEKIENEGRLAFLRFLWRYFEMAGIRPSSRCCMKCGKNLFEESKNFVGQTEENIVYLNLESYLKTCGVFSTGENGFICLDCADANNYPLTASKASLIYLESINSLSPSEVRKIPVSEKSFYEMKNICLSVLENSIGSHLKTLEAFSDIF